MPITWQAAACTVTRMPTVYRTHSRIIAMHKLTTACRSFLDISICLQMTTAHINHESTVENHHAALSIKTSSSVELTWAKRCAHSKLLLVTVDCICILTVQRHWLLHKLKAHTIYDFLLVITCNCNLSSISHCFQNIAQQRKLKTNTP